jgi:hypothetical protein
MVSAGVMTLDLGWQGMRSKFWFGVFSFAGLALVALAQDEGVEATTNKTGVTQVAPASSGAGTVSQDDTGTATAVLEGIADAVIDSVDGAKTEAADLNSKEMASSAAADDNYTPTERISEDRSVSFPVDI